MEVNDELVDKLARLARLTFKDEEKEAIKNDLEKMIGFIQALEKVDTDAVEPLLHMTGNINVLREDKAEKTITTPEALLNSPVEDPQFFKVPKVIKK